MYEVFELKKAGSGIIKGYHWPLENPEKVVLIIHGIGEYGGRYDRVAEAFAKAGIATLSMDLRGHGDSVEKKGHCAPRPEVLGDISDLIEYAEKAYPGIEKVLYGHSMGGNITLDYRCRGSRNNVPVKYVISAPWIRLVRPVPGPLYGAVRLMAKIVPSMTISSDVQEKDLGNPENVLPYHANPMVHNRISTECAVEGFEIGRMLERGTLENNGGAAGIPVLLMHGSEDKICSVEGSRILSRHLAAEAIAFAREALRPEASDEEILAEGDRLFRYKEWEGLFHEIHNGSDRSKGDEVIAEIIDFVLN